MIFRLGILSILSAAALFAQASGFVTNKSTNQAQAGVKVTLMQLSEVGATAPLSTSTSDAQGRFSFSEKLTGVYALESEFQGVKYTQVIPPMLPKDNLQVSVYDTTNAASSLAVDQHIYFLEPGPSQLVVSETFVLRNDSQRTYRNTERGTVRFHLPPDAKGIVQAAMIGPDQRPTATVAQKTMEPDIYQVNDAIPPGESRVDINYVLPYDGGAGVFRTQTRYENARTRVVVAPGVQVAGEGLESLGAEPRTQAQIFGHTGNELVLQLSGSGMIAEVASGEGPDGDAPQIESSLPSIYDNLTLITAAGAAALFFAFLLLYRRTSTIVESGASNGGGSRAG